MIHTLLVVVGVLIAWTLFSFPVGIWIGRRLNAAHEFYPEVEE